MPLPTRSNNLSIKGLLANLLININSWQCAVRQYFYGHPTVMLVRYLGQLEVLLVVQC